MTFSLQLICTLLILCCLAGIFGMFMFEEYIRKISSLSVCYSSFLALIVSLSLKNEKMNETMIILVSILAVFAVNLLIGIGIAKNIAGERSRIEEIGGKKEDVAAE